MDLLSFILGLLLNNNMNHRIKINMCGSPLFGMHVLPVNLSFMVGIKITKNIIYPTYFILHQVCLDKNVF